MYTNVRGRPGVRGMAVVVVAAMGLLLPAFAPPAAAQEKADPEQLKKAYDDALVQLKEAQNRKNQLAADNEKLSAEVASLKKQLEAPHGELERLKRADTESADKTFFLRSHYAAWQNFIRRYPDVYGRWKVFFEYGVLFPARDLPEGIDLEWPPPDKPEKNEADF